LYVCIPMFAVVIALLIWQMADSETTELMKAQGVENYVSGFDKLWSWFGWSNQTLSVFMLWAITVYLVRNRKAYIITLIPAVFMTVVCTTFFVVEQAFNIEDQQLKSLLTIWVAVGASVVSVIWFLVWYFLKGKKIKE
ncbi:MAG: hypothetical protein K2G91_06015, partial [Prevotella sp.]|nr:hypothetical protein [Prevotella sp.]